MEKIAQIKKVKEYVCQRCGDIYTDDDIVCPECLNEALITQDLRLVAQGELEEGEY